jgi:hypothetical protein
MLKTSPRRTSKDYVPCYLARIINLQKPGGDDKDTLEEIVDTVSGGWISVKKKKKKQTNTQTLSGHYNSSRILLTQGIYIWRNQIQKYTVTFRQ